MSRVVTILLAILLGFAGGWAFQQFVMLPPARSAASDSSGTPVTVDPVTRIIAQGRLQPKGGVINILAPPGQRVKEILVRESSAVVAGETELLRLESLELLELQAELASARRSETSLELQQARLNADLATRNAESALEAALLRMEQARSGTAIEIAGRELQIARQQYSELESLSLDPLTRTLVSRQQLAQQKVQVDNLGLKLEDAKRQQEQLLAAAAKDVELARASVEDSRTAAQQARKIEEESRSPELAEQIAARQLQQGRLVAPVTGTVLRVNIQPGETVTTLPVMQLGQLDEIECLAEVSELFAARVRPGAAVALRSSALEQSLRGTVTRVGSVVGSATLPEPNPLALVDRKTVEVLVALDPADVARARNWVNLQVTVEITPSRPDQPLTAPDPGS